MDQWTRTERQERSSHGCEQLAFDKCTKALQWGQRVFSSKVPETTGYPCKKQNLDPLAHIIYKNYLKMNCRPKCKS